MIAISKNQLNTILVNHQDRMDKHIICVKKELRKFIENPIVKVNKTKKKRINKNQIEYLKKLEDEIRPLMFCDQKTLFEKVKEFDEILSDIDRKNKIEGFPIFKNRLLTILGYKELRSNSNENSNPLFVDIFRELGIKSCVYCNSQLTITTKDENGKSIAKFQLDHYIDKASYPCFAISFFNLYPVCASCNNKKGNKEIGFQLYSENEHDLEASPFQFEIKRASLAKYRISRDYSKLEVLFNDQGSGLNEHMNVQDIYATQKDLAEEIIVKAEIYNISYGNSLKKSFTKLYGSGGLKNLDFNRFIVGNYTDPKDIHKRPMSKFTQDIARQLKLIP